MSHAIVPVSIGLSIQFLLMTGVFIVYRITRRASWIDVAWAGSVLLLTAWYTVYCGAKNLVHGAIVAMYSIWALRLSIFLALRLARHGEDARYLSIKERWGENLSFKFFLFFQVQGVISLLLSLPVLLVLLQPVQSFSGFEMTGFTLWLLAFMGETIADFQLFRFKLSKHNKGKVFNRGLWKYSRHPNYFFELLIWIGVFLFCLGQDWGPYSVLLPVMMAYFILKVTGIPETESQNIKSKGQAYYRYQKTTSAFIPWFPKKEHIT